MKRVAVLICIYSTVGFGKTGVIDEFYTALNNTYKAVITSGPALWDTIGTKQAKDTVEDLITESGTLEEGKNQLLIDLRAKQIPDQFVLGKRIDTLVQLAEKIKSNMDRFSYEIDKAAPEVGTDLRVQAQKARSQKIEDLLEVNQAWPDQDKVIEKLQNAITSVQQLRKVLGCLRDSMADKKPACDSSTLEPIKKAEKKSNNLP